MKLATRSPQSAPAGPAGVRDAWTAFWQEPGQSRCVAGAPDIWQPLTRHWSSLAHSMPQGARVLDLGCGAGAVPHILLGARPDLQATGVDFARIPLTLDAQLELLSETAMESLPFADASFSAVVSQFGFEYSNTRLAAREMARVLAPRGNLSLLVHHAGSAIVRTNRGRLGALCGFLAPSLRSAFCAGDTESFHTQMLALAAQFPRDLLLVELARSLPSRLLRAQRERLAIWTAVEDALAPERCLAESLNSCCVEAAQIEEWLAPLRGDCDLSAVEVLREANGDPVAWKVEGFRR